MSMKNSSDTIGNRTHDLPVCSTVPQPNAPPRAPIIIIIIIIIIISLIDSYMEPLALYVPFICHRLIDDILSKRMVRQDEIRVVFGKLRDSAKI
jgi:hypothetical protein